MEYNFREIEKKWQQQWNDASMYTVSNNSSKPKYYVLDMFPYPSGAGLHVGHPLGYIASDIYSRYKRLKGFNVLHPMGYDAFGLPAEQYAIEHGVHPADSTAQNIANFRRQLDNIGFCFDWSREVKTSDPGYYKWTQWIFLQLFHSWYNRTANKAEPIEELVKVFQMEGNLHASCPGDSSIAFTANEWNGYDEKQQQDILMQYRLAYCGEGEVNWCEALGTVLANDEVVNGVSERGGYPVVKKKLRQWYLRITEYAGRLQADLDKLEWTDAMKEMQTNWIGKSFGAEISFEIKRSHTAQSQAPTYPPPTGEGNGEDSSEEANEEIDVTTRNHGSAPPPLGEAGWGLAVGSLTVYTTRPDTIMGVDFMVVAPELEWINDIKSPEQAQAVDEYIAYVASRSERERQAEKKITGCFTGAYAINPFNGREIPIWISEYVLAGYGTGAIMAVPCGDERDFKFARHFNIPITNIIGDAFNGEEANPTKDAVLSNSGFLDGVPMRQAAELVMNQLEAQGIGRRKTNYRMRDAAFSRQRYWGEPFPIVWKDGIAYPLPESSLPLELPWMENIKPGSGGEGPLANNTAWSTAPLPARDAALEGLEKGDQELGIRETNTMPGYAGSSWYFLRYMDPHNTETFADRKVTDYWNQVDVYIGGTEHAVGHLLYSRMWTKALYDLGHISFDEPFKKLVNQGMIQGSSRFVYRLRYSYNPNIYSDLASFILESCSNHVTLPWPRDSHDDMFFRLRLDNGSLIVLSPDEIIFKALVEGEEKLIEWLKQIINTGMDYKSEKDYPPIFFSRDILPIDLYKTRISVHDFDSIHVPVDCVDGYELDIDKLREKRPFEYANAEFFVEDKSGNLVRYVKDDAGKKSGKYICTGEVEKMSKSKFNTQNPDDLVQKYGADTFRMYEMFLGPIEQSKPWDTKGIEGVHRFLKKLWRLFFSETAPLSERRGAGGEAIWNEDAPTAAELKVLHRTIKKLEDDTDRFSFNTGVSAFMVCVNELTELKCHKKAILQPLVILLSSYAPHISEELYQHLQGNTATVLSPSFGGVGEASYPLFEEKYVAESSKEYPVSINGKLRTTMTFPLEAEAAAVEPEVLANEVVQKWMEGKPLKKMVYVKGKMINVVV